MKIQEKEQLIVGTILNCNLEIKKLSESDKSFQHKNNNLYNFNMIQLYNEIIGENKPLNENQSIDFKDFNYCNNTRKNYFSYFQKVYNFLDGFEINIQQTLNESLKIDSKDLNTDILNINSFKKELSEIIEKLSKQDEISNIDNKIIKIKTLAHKPIYLYGYNICTNVELKKELQEKFKISDNDILSIIFNKTNKQLIFVIKNNLIVYDVKQDLLDYYNNINFDEKVNFKFEKTENLLQQIKNTIGYNDLIEIYQNIQKDKFQFADNLYKDKLRTEMALSEMEKNKESNMFKK
jgi:hypothetical protein